MIQPSHHHAASAGETGASRQLSSEALLAAYAGSHDPRLRAAVIERHEHLALSLARRFARPGVSFEDLAQSARVALIGAVDRFNAAHHTRFRTYAFHCMVGEIKRYFRDRTWVIKVPRRLQELAANLSITQDRLYGELQREPTIGEMAVALHATEEEILRAMEAGQFYQPRCLDDSRESEAGHDGLTIGETVGAADSEIERMVEHAPLQAALGTLDQRNQYILRMRFTGECTQQEVADQLGVSQMHVCRLERSALKQLRVVMSVPQV